MRLGRSQPKWHPEWPHVEHQRRRFSVHQNTRRILTDWVDLVGARDSWIAMDSDGMTATDEINGNSVNGSRNSSLERKQPLKIEFAKRNGLTTMKNQN